jgi:iron complex outermembrane receptor protein
MRQIEVCPHRVVPLLLAMLALPVFAQSLDEVVVSASRTEQRSFDSPAAVQRLDREVIQGGGPQVNLSESLARVSGLTILDRENYAQDLQVSIRGFGARASFGIRGIRLLIDGIPASTPDGQGQGSSISLTSMDHIEVLRGPLAQLYGNASGGVIQAFTKAAPAAPELTYQYYVGAYGLHRADYQFGDTVDGYGLVADYSTFTTDGYRSNSAAERKQFNGKMAFDPNDQTHVNVVFNQFDMPLALDALGLTSRQLAADPSQAGTGATQYSTRKTILQNQLGSSASYRLDADRTVTARAYLGARDNLQYQAATVPASGVFPATAAWTGLNRNYYGVGLQYQQRTQWADTPVEWVGGYEFDRSREFRQAGTTSAGQKTGVINRSEDNQSENSDLFAQGNALLSDRVTLTTGLRYSTVRFVSDDYYLGDGVDGSGNNSFSSVSPVLGMTLHATEALNLYANIGKGFETPTLAEVAYQNGTTVNRPVVGMFNPNLNASSSHHYEIGSKWVPAPNARVDFALYQIDTSDEIVVSISSAGQTSYKNAPGTSRSGWELSGSTQLSPHVTLSGAASQIDARYTQSFVNQTVTNGVTSYVTVAGGNKMPGIPQTSLFSELAWSSDDTPARKGAPPMGARLALELVQSGRLFANDLNTESADGHTVVNLSGSQHWALGRGNLALYGRINNASDERYVGSVIVNQSSAQYYEPGLPRNWTLGVSLTVPM